METPNEKRTRTADYVRRLFLRFDGKPHATYLFEFFLKADGFSILNRGDLRWTWTKDGVIVKVAHAATPPGVDTNDYEFLNSVLHPNITPPLYLFLKSPRTPALIPRPFPLPWIFPGWYLSVIVARRVSRASREFIISHPDYPLILRSFEDVAEPCNLGRMGRRLVALDTGERPFSQPDR